MIITPILLLLFSLIFELILIGDSILPASGYVLIKKSGQNNGTVSDVADRNEAANPLGTPSPVTPVLPVVIASTLMDEVGGFDDKADELFDWHSELVANDEAKEKEREEDVQSLLIQVFEPEQTVMNNNNNIMDARMPPALVDVDIVPLLTAKAAKGINKNVDGNDNDVGDNLIVNGVGIRRKPMPRQQMKGQKGGWQWTEKRKMVKLPPLRHFTVPAFARAAPIVQASANAENAIVSIAGLEPLVPLVAASNGTANNSNGSIVIKPSNKAMTAGREFWMNALKTLLVEFRRMHPDIALGAAARSGRIRRKEMRRSEGQQHWQQQVEANNRTDAVAEGQKKKVV